MKVSLSGAFYLHNKEVPSALIAGGIYGVFASAVGLAAYSLIKKDSLSLHLRVSKGLVGVGITATVLSILLSIEYQLWRGSSFQLCSI
jgi:hypothetical protein